VEKFSLLFLSFLSIILIIKPSKKNMSITYKPKKRKRKRTHGFLKRTSSGTGRKIIQRRRRKKRKRL